MEVKFNNVNFYYDKNTKTKILDTVNLKIQSNTITGITGHSGSGKTTMAELLTSVILPTTGKICIGDLTINKKNNFDEAKLSKLVGYLPQNFESQFFNKSVKDELCYPFSFFKTQIEEKKIIEVLREVNLDESYLNKNPMLLSNGEKRKVALASVVLFNTEIIVLDEPVIGLDGKSVKQIERLIKNLRSNFGKTIIVISRDVEFLHRVSDNIVVMESGRVLIDGNKYDVFKNTELLNKHQIPIPKTIEFSTLVLDKKNIKIGYRDEINDLLKDIYRYVK